MDRQDENTGMIAKLILQFRQEFPGYGDKVFFLTGKDDGHEPGTPESIIQSLVETHQKDPAVNTQALYSRIAGMPDFLHVEDLKKGQDGVARNIAIIKGFNADGIRDKKFIHKMLNTGGKLAEYMLAAAKTRMGEKLDQYLATSIFDHETGHIVTRIVESQASRMKTYMKSDVLSTYCETMADVYSLIRHMQRFGMHTGFPEFLRDFRARTVVQEAAATHYTVRGIDMLIRLKDQENIKDLTPAQTLALAAKISDASLVNGREGESLSATFSSISAKKTAGFTPEKAINLLEKAARKSRADIVMEAASVYLTALRAAVPVQEAALRTAIAAAHRNIKAQRQDPSLPVTLWERLFFSPPKEKKGLAPHA